jgi:hypothetical protein
MRLVIVIMTEEGVVQVILGKVTVTVVEGGGVTKPDIGSMGAVAGTAFHIVVVVAGRFVIVTLDVVGSGGGGPGGQGSATHFAPETVEARMSYL